MIHEDVIEEATGASWVSPVHIVYKGNGELRLCVDLREANKAVIRERSVAPTQWSKDVFNIEPEESILADTVVGGVKGDYLVYGSWKGLPFGLASAPEAYQRVMSIICEGLAGVLNYFDDVVVYGSTPEEH
ncbi:Uncharacterized protein P5673_010703 [Acropora cervicornis]|uniref:Reverse transcriptase domain-containing protein n=1 Tax=Acropora cervicornis TaxID=6130 RepID=A0AAD9V8U6_ACRCE|nr:Uncharacterized protein P5673_010703 [Acropora cervicornis]